MVGGKGRAIEEVPGSDRKERDGAMQALRAVTRYLALLADFPSFSSVLSGGSSILLLNPNQSRNSKNRLNNYSRAKILSTGLVWATYMKFGFTLYVEKWSRNKIKSQDSRQRPYQHVS